MKWSIPFVRKLIVSRLSMRNLEKSYDDLRFENEGRKIAWRIHGVDEFIAGKKNTSNSRKKQKL